MNWQAMIGAMIGSGLAYSLVNGYGLLHGLGMAIAYLGLGLALYAAVKSIDYFRTTTVIRRD